MRSNLLLWILAALLTLGVAAYQRITGPTRPLRGSYQVDGRTHRYKLLRSEFTTQNARIETPSGGGKLSGTLHYRRLGMDEPFEAVPMMPEAGLLVAHLPAQPPAGKLEYFLALQGADASFRVPEEPEEHVVIRFKGEVPVWALAPHVTLMFLAILLGLRTGLAALLAPGPMRRLAAWTLGTLSIGGLVFGPIVQKYAFGAYWTGFPFGYDLTDNKTLIMWLVWLAACAVLAWGPKDKPVVTRSAVVLAVVVMIGVYMIPHSLRGSTLDYKKLEEGVDPTEAIGTG